MHESERTEILQLPAIGLTQAIESVRTLWRAAEASEVTPEVAATALGYRRLGPQARKRLSAFRAYGLIDHGPSVRLTDLALTIMHLESQRQKGSRAYLDAVRTAALRPKLFREMFQSHGHAPYDALRSHLITERGLSSTSARTFIAAFRDAIAAGGFAETESPALENDRPVPAPHQAVGLPGDADEQRGEQSHVFRWPLSKGATAELRLIGDEVTAADINRLSKYVDLVRLALLGDDGRSKSRHNSSRRIARTSPDRRSGTRRHGR